MVAFVASQPLDMRNFFAANASDPEVSFTATATQLKVVKESSAFTARGVNFTYDSEGSWTGGTVQQMEESRGGGLAWKLTGAAYAATTIQAYADATTTSQLAALNVILFAGADSVTGSAGMDWLGGFGGNDTINGNAGNDVLEGGAGNDRLVGGLGNDTLRGGAGNDTYQVNAAGDVVTETSTGGSADTLISTAPTYTLGAYVERLVLGGTGNLGGSGNALNNLLTGNAGANTLNGGTGNDTISGGSGADSLLGGSGADVLIGGVGNDSLTGGTGADIFRFDRAPSGTTNVDRLGDFRAVDDTIQLDNAVFAAVGANGALSAAAFRAGSSAGDASDRIVYNAATGQIFYDANGNGAGGQVLFATVATGTAINAADFFVI